MPFRRVVYHRSWFMIVVGTLALASIAGNWVAHDNVSPELDWLALLGSLVALLMIARGLTGEWGKRQLRVDVAGGKLQLPDGSQYELDQLGELALETKLLPRTSSRSQTRVHEHRLRAANVEYYLFFSVYESETKLRLAAVDSAVLQYRLRRVLERPAGDGAFRSVPDPDAELLEIAGTRERAIAALTALAKTDPDSQLRARADEQRAKLTRDRATVAA